MRAVQVSPKRPAWLRALRGHSPGKAYCALWALRAQATRSLLAVLAVVLLVVSPAGGALSERAPMGTVGGTARSESASRAASIRAIRLVFGARAPAAIRVARCETGGTFDPRAVGRAGERGLFQIHPVHFGWAQPRRLFDPVWNSRVAYRLSRGGRDWRPWSCRWAA